ncbi:MAG: transcription-repair coupling factor [Cyanobacteria bacterium J007]|nr:MAG: transcription-repair coupling factor [Cyanobacteria bacterium J007]
MAFSSILRTLGRSPLATELLAKLEQQRCIQLDGIGRLPKGLIASTLAQEGGRPLVVVTATLEEASRWAAQLEAMGWQTVHFYPTSEASPYEPFDPESETIWGQLQVLADLLALGDLDGGDRPSMAIVVTQRALQPHLPPVDRFAPYCWTLTPGTTCEGKAIDEKLARLGYDRVPLVEMEGQWSRRGDIVDIFPVSAELPVRLDWFGDDLEQMREFDPSTQRSLDKIDRLVLTPTSFRPAIEAGLTDAGLAPIAPVEVADENRFGEGARGIGRLLGLAFDRPASILDYLAPDTLVAIDEPQQCQAHGDRWFQIVEDHYQIAQNHDIPGYPPLARFHEAIADTFEQTEAFDRLYLSELAESRPAHPDVQKPYNLDSRPVPVMPHQFGKMAAAIREQRDRRFGIFIVSAQPSRSVSLLQEHDCPAQFVANPRDYRTIDRLQIEHTPIAVRYKGLAEIEGFVLDAFRIALFGDREFYGQHLLATPSYIRKRRRAKSTQVDPNKLRPGDYVVHRHHGIGRFIKLEKLENREYLAVKYADGLLKVRVDQLDSLSRFRQTGRGRPQLNKLQNNKAWEKTKNKVRKAIKKLAVDLLDLYAKRSKQQGFLYPPDMPWQQELEDSFPYQPTPDQLKATQDVKRDMEGDRPMDRLVCGDVGFGKTEVAIRAIFKAVTAGKQVALLAPTTILTQQHYHTLKERFAPYPIQVALLNRFRTAQERRDIQQRLATGELDVVVGTHSILGKTVKFRDLGLLVVDEEQRFGVNQKEKIKSYKTQVDVLTLSATPIPRTLYMAMSGIREMSLITTPPPSRRPIQTHLAPYDEETVRTAIRQELDRGGQVFYVVPRIEGIDELAASLQQTIPSARIAIAHGQMAASELESIVLGFSSGEADILVCTTIIESGLDIPRVNTILIEDAHRFGLSQLYQLRGRVGRAGIQAHAWMFYPKDKVLSDDARKRLRAIQEFSQLGSGYQLAMRDMEIRGVGNLLGAEQSGQMDAIGFDLYMEMLQEAIREIRGQEIPQVEETQVDLPMTAFIPTDYITDLDQKMVAYRQIASASSRKELTQIAADWSDRYGPLPNPVKQLMQIVELKQIAKPLGFSRIKPEGQNIILETPMEEPAWNVLKANLSPSVQEKFVYSKGRVSARGLSFMRREQQLEYLIDILSKMQGALPETAIAAS